MNWLDDFETGITIYAYQLELYLKAEQGEDINENDRAYERDGKCGDFGYLIDIVPPSGHDWTQSVTVQTNGRLRHEYRTTVDTYAGHNISDGLDEEHALGFHNLEMVDDQMYVKGMRLCKACMLFTPKVKADCQNCYNTPSMSLEKEIARVMNIK